MLQNNNLKYFVLFSAIIMASCGTKKDANIVDGTGNIEATNIVISAKTQGEIKSLRYDEGALINVGDTLMVIDNESLRIQLSNAEGTYESAQAQYELTVNGARKEDIKQAEEGLKQAKINFEQAKVDNERVKKLYQSKLVSQKQYEDTETRYNLTYAQLNSANENYLKIKNISRPEDIKNTKGNLKKAASSMDLIKKNIKDSYIVSPINGFIIKKFVEKGEFVNPASSLFKIADLSEVKLTIYVSELDLSKVKLGQRAIVTIDGMSSKNYEGKVSYISPEAEFTPKNIQTKDERVRLVYAVKITIPNPSFELKIGMPADAAIQTQS